jgi:hypothetical protein
MERAAGAIENPQEDDFIVLHLEYPQRAIFMPEQ